MTNTHDTTRAAAHHALAPYLPYLDDHDTAADELARAVTHHAAAYGPRWAAVACRPTAAGCEARQPVVARLETHGLSLPPGCLDAAVRAAASALNPRRRIGPIFYEVSPDEQAGEP